MDPASAAPAAFTIGQLVYDHAIRKTPKAKMQRSAERMKESMKILKADGAIMRLQEFDRHTSQYKSSKIQREELEGLTKDRSGIFNKRIRDKADQLNESTIEMVEDVRRSSEEANLRKFDAERQERHRNAAVSGEIKGTYVTGTSTGRQEENDLSSDEEELPEVKTSGFRSKYVARDQFDALRKHEEAFERFSASILSSALQSTSGRPDATLGYSEYNPRIETDRTRQPAWDLDSRRPGDHAQERSPTTVAPIREVARPSAHVYSRSNSYSDPPRDLYEHQYREYQQGEPTADKTFRYSTDVSPPESIFGDDRRLPNVPSLGRVDEATTAMASMSMAPSFPHHAPSSYLPPQQQQASFQSPPPRETYSSSNVSKPNSYSVAPEPPRPSGSGSGMNSGRYNQDESSTFADPSMHPMFNEPGGGSSRYQSGKDDTRYRDQYGGERHRDKGHDRGEDRRGKMRASDYNRDDERYGKSGKARDRNEDRDYYRDDGRKDYSRDDGRDYDDRDRRRHRDDEKDYRHRSEPRYGESSRRDEYHGSSSNYRRDDSRYQSHKS